MSALNVIELHAGSKPDGSPVLERLSVKVLEDNSCQLVRSPAFIKGLASGDVIKFDSNDNSFELLKRSGNLCIRIFSRSDIEAIATDLTPALEKLGGEQDYENERMLVYSIHVSIGFNQIESLLNDHVDENDGSMWLYGNVYDEDGETPLKWWEEILKPQ